MKIAVAGSGAMGGRFGYMLSKTGNDVTLIDQWEPHVAAIREKGLQINLNGKDIVAKLPIFFPSEAVSKGMEFELVILFTKAMQLEGMLQALDPIVTNKNTYVICLLNGIGHEKVIEKYVPETNVLFGNTMWTAGLVGPGKIKLHGSGAVDLRNLHPDGKQAALKVIEVFNEAGLSGVYTEDIHYTIYKKACVNGTVNGLCTLLDANMNSVGSRNYGASMIRTIVGEFTAVAAAEGVNLDQEAISAYIINACDPDVLGLHYPSMHQDLIGQNRLTEIDYINGVIAKKGKEYGIPTPYCTFLTELVHCKEEILKAT